MKSIILFTDGSVDPQSKIGFGAYLTLVEQDFIGEPLSMSSLQKQIKLKKFINTSSTQLELQTLLWAGDEMELKMKKVTLYSDCQNIIGLEKRRIQFEKNNYLTKKNKKIKHYKLYQVFYKLIDQCQLDIIKIKGHQPLKQKNQIDKIFSLVDKSSRRALRASLL